MKQVTVDAQEDLAMEAIRQYLAEVRQLDSRLSDLCVSVKFGSPVYRGLQLVQRDLQNAASGLQRLHSHKRKA